MNYATLTTRLATFAVTSPTNANFLIALPEIIEIAENRIYRECNFLNQRGSTSTALTANNRNLTLPQVTTTAGNVNFKVVQSISIITPAATAPDAGTRNYCQRVSREFLDFYWASAASSPGVPVYWSMLDDQTVRFAPSPDQTYNAEIVGSFRPVSMGSNAGVPSQTYLGDNYPDLLFAGCMVALSGYQKNFGSMADDPKMALSWEAAYQALVQTAVNEALLQKGEGEAWTPYMPSKIAQPART